MLVIRSQLQSSTSMVASIGLSRPMQAMDLQATIIDVAWESVYLAPIVHAQALLQHNVVTQELQEVHARTMVVNESNLALDVCLQSQVGIGDISLRVSIVAR